MLGRFFSWIAGLFKKKEINTNDGTGHKSEASDQSSLTPSWPTPPVPLAPGSVPTSRPKDLPASNHYYSRNRSLMEQEYQYLWPLAKVQPDYQREAKMLVDWAKHNRGLFDLASEATKVPWWVIAGINQLEMGMNFNGTILNGDSWKDKTTHYPPGLGPWKNWLDACIWGLRYEARGWNFDLAKFQWTVGGTFYFAECYNGHNARLAMGLEIIPANASPYIYSGTQFYQKGKLTEVESSPGSGKYVGKFRPDLVSSQVGFMAFAKALQDSGEELFS